MEAWVHAFDTAVLHYLNVDCASPGMDQFWLTVTHLERVHWLIEIVLPLLLVSLLHIYRWSAFGLLGVFGLTVGITDAIAARVIKPLVYRARPFENPEYAGWLRHVGDAHGLSFPSNHAANCFAGAVILSWYFPRLAKYFYTLAIIVSLSRIALGVHYPTDVLAGALLGIIVGGFVRTFVLNLWPAVRLQRHVSNKDRTFVGD